MKNLNITYDNRAFAKMFKVKKNFEKKNGNKISWEDLVFMAIMQV